MEIKVLENNNILIHKNDMYYLIEKSLISGTFIENYFVYSNDYFNNLEDFINSEEEERYFINEYTTLEQAIKDIQEKDL